MAWDKKCPFCKKDNSLNFVDVRGGDGHARIICYHHALGHMGAVDLLICESCGRVVVSRADKMIVNIEEAAGEKNSLEEKNSPEDKEGVEENRV